MTKSTHVDWERLGEARRMVGELPAEDREQGARLNGQYWALVAAIEELSGEKAISSEEYREHTVEILKELKKEIRASFDVWREERGIPKV